MIKNITLKQTGKEHTIRNNFNSYELHDIKNGTITLGNYLESLDIFVTIKCKQDIDDLIELLNNTRFSFYDG
jgi:hypothetical protein